ncbi:MAG: Histidine kinase [Thelocarpon superellum]|nr:MAG: Histidine kinase [Thelocarpon superellum]
MRIPIREQLGLLVLLTSLIALATIAVATWVNNYNFVVGIRSSRLALTASLKAAQLSSNLLLLQTSTVSLSQSVTVQLALQRYNDQDNNTAANWVRAAQDVQPGLGTGGEGSLLLQAMVFPKNGTGSNGPFSLLNVTGQFNAGDGVPLPYRYANGTPVMLGDVGMGYPAAYYPNLTYTNTTVNSTYNSSTARVFDVDLTGPGSAVMLGPFQINESFALVSITVPVINNTSAIDILGYMSVIINARTIYDVINSPEGLDSTGQTLLVGPLSPDNRFPASERTSNKTVVLHNATAEQDLLVSFELAPTPAISGAIRHGSRAFGRPDTAFPMKQYPAVLDVFTQNNVAINNAGSLISSTNEEGYSVSVGYALPATMLCDWALLMEEDESEAFAPIVHLRNVLVACVFGTVGAILLLVFPIAHFSVRPIRRLREATKRSIQPPGFTPDGSECDSTAEQDQAGGVIRGDEEDLTNEKKASVASRFLPWPRRAKKSKSEKIDAARRRSFRIPAKVQDGKHVIKDELTDLTQTFNEMSDELMMQYEKLEERVEERTRELEISKKAAEAANESKTLFIANISHELKTPLNGILGMTAICMQEEDLAKIKRSLGIIYKSGDLLLHLLTDLLTFSKNEIGRQLSLEEKEFRLSEISSQILSIFDKQAMDGKISLRATFHGPDGQAGEKGMGPPATGRVRDMCLWGDQNRILQVIINLVSNSLKFTPPGQAVELRIKCLGDAELEREGSQRGSLASKRQSSRQSKRAEAQISLSDSSDSPSRGPARDDFQTHMDKARAAEAAPSKHQSQTSIDGPPASLTLSHARTLLFEFEVEDSGPGIAEHLQDRVFQPFVQGDLGLSKKFGGTGLGLSICSQLAKLMKGTINLRSQEGVGSTFTMRIPLKYTKELADSTTSSAPRENARRDSLSIAALGDDPLLTPRNLESGATLSPGAVRSNNNSPINGTTNNSSYETASKPRLVGLSQPFFAPPPAPGTPEQLSAIEQATAEASKTGDKVRVLVAEDNKVNQEVVLRMLKLEDIYDVTVARDGQEAYEMVKESMEQKRLFNLIFMDIQMPNVDGLESTRLIRSMGYSAPIVALTAFAEESNVKECMDSGMNYFLSKPIRRPALKQVLKNYCATIPEEAAPSVDATP